MEEKAVAVSRRTLRGVEFVGLAVIAVATIIATVDEITSMFQIGKVTLADLLMLFIYLEVLAMVGIYLESRKLPVRMPLYIAMVALARFLILDMKDLDVYHLLAVGGTVLLLALAVLVIRYGHVRYPYTGEGLEPRIPAGPAPRQEEESQR